MAQAGMIYSSDGSVSVDTGSLSATVAAVGDVTDMGSFRTIAFTISGLATETIAVTGDLALGTAFSNQSAAIRPVDVNTGALAAASALGNGSYVIRDWPYNGLRFTKSAAADTVTIRFVKRNY